MEWSDFLSVIKNPEFRFAVVFTLWTSLLATLMAAVTAVPCSFILSRYNFPGKVLIDTLMDIPIVLPPLVSGLALLILLGPILGNALVQLGLEVVFSARGVVVAQWFIATPFAIKTFKQAFDGIDPRLENVARTLGYSPAEVFLRVTMPLAKGGILSGLTMTWSRALGEFGATAMLAGITRMKTETLSVAIFLNMTIGDMQFAIATAVIMLMVALILMSVIKVFTATGVRL
ncbi:MAG: ABC transporter permease [Desulfotomaculaceae bacterium]|nr:ABC transporter permease [Desulfotomaculaceae bacterium]